MRKRVSSQAYESYLRDLVPDEAETADQLVVRVPDRFTAERLDRAYGPLIAVELERVLGHEVHIAFRADPSMPRTAEPSAQEMLAPPTTTARPHRPRLAANPRYTFDRFVVGPCNRVAEGAARSIAEGDSRLFNPFFLYGHTGLGKSHLAGAIGHHIRRYRPRTRVLYLSAEKFVNEMVAALKQNRAQTFKDRFRRDCDVLILDDLQFLSGKTRSQGELFHTLDTLYAAGKQVVLVSDAPPKDIPDIDEGLRSRFGCGLVVDVRPPGYDTRRAILDHRIATENLQVPEDVVHYVAANVRTNVRDLEGSLLRVVSVASFGHRDLDVALAAEALRELVRADDPVSVPAIIALVAQHFQITPEALTGKSRRRTTLLPRQIAIYLARQFCEVSVTELGRAFNRDHSTVLHSLKAIEKKMAARATLKRQVEFLAAKVDRPE